MSTTHSKRDFSKASHLSNKLKKSVSSELEFALQENAHLESQNRMLKSEAKELIFKNENLMKALNLNKERFEQDFNKLQEEIRQNENHLVENSRKCLDQQKKYAQEVKILRQDNENLKKSRAKSDESLIEKLKGLESEIKLLKLGNENLQAQHKETEQKCVKYKAKLKHAVKIVNDMNQIVLQCQNKPKITCETTQTDKEYIGDQTSIQDCSQCGDTRYKINMNSENLMLSDIFFKPKTFMESDVDLFAVKSRPGISSKTESAC